MNNTVTNNLAATSLFLTEGCVHETDIQIVIDICTSVSCIDDMYAGTISSEQSNKRDVRNGSRSQVLQAIFLKKVLIAG